MVAAAPERAAVLELLETLPVHERRQIVARLNREGTVQDKSYQDCPIGGEAAAYLRIKRKRLSENSMMAYESTLDKFARAFYDLDLRDLEPPVGTERIEAWLDREWGKAQPATYNRHLAVIRDFCKFHVIRGNLRGDPTLIIEPARKRESDSDRTTFAEDHVRAIIASQEEIRDRIALRLLLHYGIRKGGLQAVQFKHFDHVRKRLTVFLKGGKVRALPIPEPAFWHDLERHIIEAEAKPSHYLMTARFANRYGFKDKPDQPMSGHALHKWWYRCLAKAGVVEEGETRGERMHKARHTAGQRILDETGNLKAAQNLLMHASIQTTGDVYADWDINQLTQTMALVYGQEDE